MLSVTYIKALIKHVREEEDPALWDLVDLLFEMDSIGTMLNDDVELYGLREGRSLPDAYGTSLVGFVHDRLLKALCAGQSAHHFALHVFKTLKSRSSGNEYEERIKIINQLIQDWGLDIRKNEIVIHSFNLPGADTLEDLDDHPF